MDWRRFVMEWGWLGMAIPLLGLVGTTFYSIVQDSKGWKKVQSKIGGNRRASLEEQHEDIKDEIKVRTEGIEKTIINKTSNIYSKVDNIDKITARNEALYQNLSLDQKEVRNNINKLVYDWERTITENKELKSLNEKLSNEINFLKESNVEIKVENQVNKEKLDKVLLANSNILEENSKLKNEIYRLTEKNKNLYKKVNKLESEDSWESEI